MSFVSRFLPVLVSLLLFATCGDPGPKPVRVQAGPNAVAGRAPATLRVLTWRYLAQDAQLVADFERRQGINVEVVVRPLRAIVADAAAKRPLNADVVLLPTLEDAVRLRDFGALQPFFVDAFSEGYIGDRFLDNEGYWAGLTAWTMVNVYNPNAITEAEASTYQGVLTVANRGLRVGVAHPDSSGMAGVVAGLYAEVSPEAATAWSEIIYRRAQGGPQGSDRDQLERMLRGELDMAFVSSGAATRWFLDGDPQHFAAGKTWKVRFPRSKATDANYLNMTCVVMPATVAHRPAAVKFIDYLYQQEVQNTLGTNWFEYPVHATGRADDYLLAYFQTLGYDVMGETLDRNIPNAWSIINQVAERNGSK